MVALASSSNCMELFISALTMSVNEMTVLNQMHIHFTGLHAIGTESESALKMEKA